MSTHPPVAYLEMFAIQATVQTPEILSDKLSTLVISQNNK
jgi:hypothetical protein